MSVRSTGWFDQVIVTIRETTLFANYPSRQAAPGAALEKILFQLCFILKQIFLEALAG